MDTSQLLNGLSERLIRSHRENNYGGSAKYVDAPVAANAWHVLRVQFKGTSIQVLLDGKAAIAFKDAHITGPGAVGVWTKADSVTAFDDFVYGTVRP